MLCWVISFYYGCRYVEMGQSVLRANQALLKEQSGPPHPAAMVKIAALQSILDVQGSAAGKYAVHQFRFLAIGAGFYVGWHVLGMALCTPGVQSRLADVGSCVAAAGH